MSKDVNRDTVQVSARNYIKTSHAIDFKNHIRNDKPKFDHLGRSD